MPDAPTLTQAQARVVEQLRRGGTVESIAWALFLSPNTVKTHLRMLYRLYGVHDRAALLAAVGEP